VITDPSSSSVAHVALRRTTPQRIRKNVSARHGYSALCQCVLAHAMTQPNVMAFDKNPCRVTALARHELTPIAANHDAIVLRRERCYSAPGTPIASFHWCEEICLYANE
jgi:hypothetical protein